MEDVKLPTRKLNALPQQRVALIVSVDLPETAREKKVVEG